MATLATGASSLAAGPVCDARPLPAYAHNDYLNPEPLTRALDLGYRGVEVDVYRRGERLLVGHDRSDLTELRTLRGLYLEPLRRRVRACPSGGQIRLNVELKEKDPEAVRVLVRHFEDFPDLFEPDPGGRPPRVVPALVGYVDETAAMPKFVLVQFAMDSPATIDPARDRIGLVSLDYTKSIRWSGRGAPSVRASTRVARAVERAKALGAPLRVHQVPARREIYMWLLSSGVELIGVKDLEAGARVLPPPRSPV